MLNICNAIFFDWSRYKDLFASVNMQDMVSSIPRYLYLVHDATFSKFSLYI